MHCSILQSEITVFCCSDSIFISEDEGSSFLRNVCIHLQVNMALKPIRPPTTKSQLLHLFGKDSGIYMQHRCEHTFRISFKNSSSSNDMVSKTDPSSRFLTHMFTRTSFITSSPHHVVLKIFSHNIFSSITCSLPIGQQPTPLFN